MPYQIRQKRFGGDGCISDSISFTFNDKTTQSSEDSMIYQDLVMTLDSGSFSSNSDYYLHLELPQNKYYSYEFDLKLVNTNSSTDNTYQFIRHIIIASGANVSKLYNVCLYQDSNGNIKAMIPHKYIQDPSENTILNDLYYDGEDGTTNGDYYLGSGELSYTKITDVNPSLMSNTWSQEDTDDTYGVFDIVFRPVDDNFNSILIEMQRTTQDMSIQTSQTDDNGNTTTIYGRTIDKSKTTATLHTVTNIVDSINRDGELTKIGVWSHPGLLMIINGDEIHVGPSGYYEEDVIPVTSIGFVAKDYNDNWTMDYVFDTSSQDETEED